MSLVDHPDVMEQGRVGLSPIARFGGTGSVSTLSIDEEEAQQAARRRGPLGFAAPEYRPLSDEVFFGPALRPRGSISDALSDLVNDDAARQTAQENQRIERELRDVGECLWTARDVLSVVQTNDGRLEVRYA